MKIFKIMMMALVAMCGLNSCSDDCNHDFIEVDYSKKLAGTWTCIEPEDEFAEALIFNADGTVTSTGVFEGGYYEKKGTFNIKGNQMTLSFEDGDSMESRFEMVEGEVFSLVDDELDVHFNYYYCENDLADEVVGMWVVANGGPDMTIETFNEDGTATFTGVVDGNMHLNVEVNYKVVGDLMIYTIGEEETIYTPYRLIYSPNATSYGDLMTWQLSDEFSFTRLRVKQHLNLTGKTYDYSAAYVTNAKGADEDFTIAGETFNIANITGYDFDEMFGSDLFSVEFPNANTIKHKFRPNGQNVEDLTPITVDGNKVTLDMGASNPAWRTVEMYMFQDADNSQLHIFMSTQSCINYLANLEIPALIEEGKLDPTDAAAVEKVFADMEARIESINVTFVMKVRK
jgi:hypothetical protein